jgi:thiamine-monophosphate kinase
MNLRQVGEDELLRKLTPLLPLNRSVIAGPGDDCAVVRFDDSDKLLLLKTDCVVQGIHFIADAKPRDIGWKAMARPLSDFAAMSGLPQFALVTFIAPSETAVNWTRDVYRGIEKAASAFDVCIVGGETSRIDGPIAISVSVTGVVEKDRWVSRAGGKVGDEVFVTGELGGSIRGKHLSFTPRVAEARWLTKQATIHAMMDLSDGLGADLPRLAAASGLGYDIDESAVPRTRGCSTEQAISDGEDYELLFAVAAEDAERLQRIWGNEFPKLRLTRIGRLTARSKTKGRKALRGYAHFQ